MSEQQCCEECGSALAGDDGTTWPVHCPVCAERIAHQTEVRQLRAEIERLRAELAFEKHENSRWGIVCDEMEIAADEIERLRAAEADLFDKCGELQKLVWKLEAARAAGGGE